MHIVLSMEVSPYLGACYFQKFNLNWVIQYKAFKIVDW